MIIRVLFSLLIRMHPWVRRDLLRLARRPEGVFVNPFERGEVGPDLFRAACNRPYQAGRSRHWVKMLWGGGRRGLWHSRESFG